MIGVPVVTVERTTVEPPNTGCSAVMDAPSAVTSVASVSTPEPVLMASRAAISLPSAPEASSTAAGLLSATS